VRTRHVDNKMHLVHAAELEHFGLTVAIINRAGLSAWHDTEEAYTRDVAHRFAHRMQEQPAGTVRLYGPDRVTELRD